MLPTLYKTSKTGKVQLWRTWTEGNIVVSEFGFQGGTIQREERTIYEGTNIGKKNERTCDEQAEFIAESNWKAQQNYKGYVTDLKKEKHTGIKRKPKGGPNCMKCKEYSPKLMLNIGYPCYAQPKIDGVMVMAEQDKLWATGGDEYVGFPLIYGDLRKILHKDEIINGELYLHGMPLKRISGIARKKKEIDYEAKNLLELWLFDAPVIGDYSLNDPFSVRFAELAKRVKGAGLERLKIVPTFRINSEAQLMQKHKDFVSNHFEGTIIRKIDMSFYQSKSSSDRSKEILKLKDFKDGEFRIIGVGEVEERNGLKMIGSFLCRTDDGKTFSVRPKGTVEDKVTWLLNPVSYMNKLLTVRYLQMWDGIPQIPVGHHIREAGE